MAETEPSVEGSTAPKADGFAMIPHWVIRDSSADRNGLLVYVALMSFADRNGECFPSISAIAKAARTSDSTARSGVRQLERLGLVVTTLRQRESNGAQTSNTYRLTRTPPTGRYRGPHFSLQGAPPEVTDEVEPREEQPSEEVNITLTSDGYINLDLDEIKGTQVYEHRSDVAMSPKQLTFMSDCFIILYDDEPAPEDIREWARYSSSDAHAWLRKTWTEIESNGPHIFNDALNSIHRAKLSANAISALEKRVAS